MERKRSRSRARSSSSKSRGSQSHARLRPGDALGKYEVVKVISDGTFGRVVEASAAGRLFAIKVRT